MPKSYLSDEPGAQRAARNRFDPFAQTWNRLVAFYGMGHAPAKIEPIILEGPGLPIHQAIKSTLLAGALRL